MADNRPAAKPKRKLYYGWVVVATSMLLMASNSSVLNSFGVFFKPLAADFGWDRATTAGIHSTFLISLAVFAIIGGYLADRLGLSKVLAFCAVLTALGLALTSRVTALWQIYLTYGVLSAAGLCVTFAVTGITTARWFTHRRGMALGIASSGVGVGMVFGVPAIARLIAILGWSTTYLVMAAVVSSIMITGAFLLKRSPEKPPTQAQPRTAKSAAAYGEAYLQDALRTRALWMICGTFFLFSVCNQLINVHLVNYATDIGIEALAAATLMSVIGFASGSGRVLMGTASDRIGNLNTLAIAATGMAVALTWLLFAREMWMLYIFAAVFGFNVGAEVPQQTAVVGNFFGLRTMLVGFAHSASNLGGAAGAWMAGKVFDMTQSYQLAFIIGVLATCIALTAILLLSRPKFQTARVRGL